MLKWCKSHPWLAAIIFVAIFYSVVFFGSLFVGLVREICTKDEYTGQPDCAQHHLGPWITLWIIGVVDAHNGFVTAIGTLAVAVFTLTLWRTSKSQGDIAQQSIDLARDEFNATHRPKLVMGPIQLVDFTKGKPIKIHWAVVNEGTGRGRIIESNASVFFATEPLPADAPYSLERDSMNTGQWIDTGRVSTTTADFTPSLSDWVVYDLSQKHDTAPQSLYFFGFVTYEGSDEQTRGFAFCRRYNPDTQRFLTVEDNIYEHSV